MEAITKCLLKLLFTTWIGFVECTRTSECQQQKQDIVFILDGSGSISQIDFQTIKDFSINVVQGLEIGPKRTQISAISYSSGVNDWFNLNSYQNKADVIDAISRLKYVGGGTATNLALEHAGDHIFSASNGARPDVSKVVIIITDGRSNSMTDTINAATQLHNQGIEIIAIGVGSGVGYQELQGIATNGQVYNVTNFNSLGSIRGSIQSSVCEAVPVCHRKPTDIIFVIDTTTPKKSVVNKTFKIIENFIHRLNRNFSYQIGIVGISFEPFIIVPLTHINNSLSVIESLHSVLYRPSPVFTEKAVEMTLMNLVHERSSSRSRYLILVYNGMSTYRKRTINAAAEAHSRYGCNVMAVGNGEQVDHAELVQVVSREHYVFSPTGNDLVNRVIFETSKHCDDCVETNMTDILLMVDSSGNNKLPKFQLFLNTLEKLETLLFQTSKNIKIGLFSFSESVNKELSLVDLKYAGFLSQAASKIRRQEMDAMPEKALRYARTTGFSENSGGRLGARKIVVMLTNANWKHKEDLKLESQLLRKSNVTVITIGVGFDVNPHNYDEIASDPHHSYLILDNDYNVLKSIVSELKYVKCNQ